MTSPAIIRPARLAYAAAMALSLTGCNGSQSYRLVDLGAISCGAGGSNCHVGKVNDWCEVAGWDVPVGGSTSAYVWRPPASGNATCSSKTKLTLAAPNPRLVYDPNWDKYNVVQQGPIWIPQPGSPQTSFQAYDINNAGEVVGNSSGTQTQAIIWSTRANGPILDDQCNPTGMIRSRSAKTAYLGALSTNNPTSKAYSINYEAQIAGSSILTPATSSATCSSTGTHAIFFNYWDGMRDLCDLSHSGGNDFAEATAIGEGGQVAGTGKAATGNHAFFWDQSFPLVQPPKAIFDLGDLPGGADLSSANAVSRWSVVVGQSGVPNGNHAFVWDQTWGMRDLGDLPGGAESSVAYAIRDTTRPSSGGPAPPGDIVGSGSIATGTGGQRAVIWPAPATAGAAYGAPVDLNTRINPPAPTVTLIEARGINRFGVISAKGVVGGANHVYLLVPADADVVDPASGKSPYQQFCTGPFTQ